MEKRDDIPFAVSSPSRQHYRPRWISLLQWAAVAATQTMVAVKGAETTFPHAEIRNSQIRAELFLPDTEKGYYRGTRFDWSGVVHSLTFKGHQYFGQWFEKHDPLVHDAITGPVNVFETGGGGLGYIEAGPGGKFVRIGVGLLEKPDGQPYQGTHTYKILNAGNWKITKGTNWIEFTQTLPDEIGYGYIYSKRISLTEGKPEMVISYSLKNSGSKVIDTPQFNHNFFVMDGITSGPGMVAQFNFEPRTRTDLGGVVQIHGKEIHFLKALQGDQRVYAPLDGFSPSAARDYDIRVENHKAGSGVRITSDMPLAKLIFWSRPRVVGPEPYIALRIDPGRTARWRTTYSFYIMEKSMQQKEVN